MTEIRRWSRKKLIMFYASLAVLVTLFVGLSEDFLMPVVFKSDLLFALLAALLATGVVLAIRAYQRGVGS